MNNELIKKLCAASVLALALTAGTAQSATLTFNDITGSTGGLPMPAEYGGFTWSSAWHAMVPANAPSETFLALSNGEAFILSNGGADFFFDGADFWSRRGVDANGRFYYQLYNDNVPVYDGFADNIRMDFTATPTLLAPDYAGPIDMVILAFDVKGEGGDWNHLAMDNFRYRPAVIPLPASAWLMVSGLMALALRFRKNSRRV